VGLERAWLNLIEYPVTAYSHPSCRGLPPVWGPAVGAFGKVVNVRLWTASELTLWVNTYVAPVVALWAVVIGIRARKDRSVRALAAIAVGALCLVLWLEMRARAGGEPHPVWYALVPSLAVIGSELALLRLSVRTWILGVSSALFAATMLLFWVPRTASAWRAWPPYHPRYGFAHVERDAIFDDQVWGDVARIVHRHTRANDPIFVALTLNTGHEANLPIFYWLTDRRPGSRFIEFDPCLTDTAETQRMIVRDIEAVDVVVASPYYHRRRAAVDRPPTVLDDYLTRNFVQVYRASVLYPDDYVVLVRKEAGIEGVR
jgi:hypothetical protein